ncbi:neuralized-like protein 4 [Saccoglossus kowalevskii]
MPCGGFFPATGQHSVGEKVRLDMNGSWEHVEVDSVLGVSSISGGVCEYQKRCEQFKASLGLNDCYFNKDHDMCYCDDCHSERGDDLYYTRGDPPKEYALPIGWCRFALDIPKRAKDLDVFNKWHVAFHGTTKEAVESILQHGDLLMPGDELMNGHTLGERDGHIKPENAPEGFDKKQLFLSPSIRYSGRDVYALRSVYKDTLTGITYNAKIAFQVCINPGKYNVGAETIDALEQIDSAFSNDEIEWFTKKRGCVIMYRLLIKLF